MRVLVGIGSVKGSPGVTTTGLGLAAIWPGSTALLVEADPSGGDVAAWYGIGEDPGLVSLAAAARRASDVAVDIRDHAHDLGSGLYVVPGPLGADQAGAAVGLLAARSGTLRRTLNSAAGVDVVIVDLGRLDAASPAERLLGDLDVLVVTARGDVPGLAHLASRGPALAGRSRGPFVCAVLTHGCPYRTSEVEDAIGMPLLATLPDDAPTAAAIAGQTAGSRRGHRRGRWDSRPLIAALRQVADRLDGQAEPRATPSAPAALMAPTRPHLTPLTATGTDHPPEPDSTRAARPEEGSPWIRSAQALLHHRQVDR